MGIRNLETAGGPLFELGFRVSGFSFEADPHGPRAWAHSRVRQWPLKMKTSSTGG